MGGFGSSYFFLPPKQQCVSSSLTEINLLGYIWRESIPFLNIITSYPSCGGLCRGLGMETAKNLILAGPGVVTLSDDEPVALPDLGANFFLEEGDVGEPRAR